MAFLSVALVTLLLEPLLDGAMFLRLVVGLGCALGLGSRARSIEGGIALAIAGGAVAGALVGGFEPNSGDLDIAGAMSFGFVGALLGLVASPPLASAAVNRAARPHDTGHFHLGLCGLWMVLIASYAEVVGAGTTNSVLATLGFGRSLDLWMAPLLVGAVGAGLLITALVRHSLGLKWLRRVYEGAVPGWAIRAHIDESVQEALDPLLSSVTSRDAVLELTERTSGGPFRDAPARFALALVDAAPATEMLARSRQQLYQLVRQVLMVPLGLVGVMLLLAILTMIR